MPGKTRESGTSSGQRPYQPMFLFFPAACLLAGLTVPLSVLAVLSGSGWPPGLLAAGHGHEMIFGFALALIAGYALGPLAPGKLLPLFFVWLMARITWLLFPDTLLASVLSPVFALALAWRVVPRFFAAKKWRNQLTGPLIMVLCLLAVLWGLLPPLRWLELPTPDEHALLHVAVLGLLLLMTFMGGRIIAPAVAGTLEKRGIGLEARVQPRLEAALLIVLPLAMLSVPFSAFRPLTAVLLLTAGLLIVLRTARWKLWHCTDRPDLLVFGIGYLWLAIGALATGLTLLGNQPPAASLHLITVAALGTLATSVMARLCWQRARRCPPPGYLVWTLSALMAGAALSRLGAGTHPFGQPLLLSVSAILWSVGFLVLAIHLLYLRFSMRKRSASSRNA